MNDDSNDSYRVKKVKICVIVKFIKSKIIDFNVFYEHLNQSKNDSKSNFEKKKHFLLCYFSKSRSKNQSCHRFFPLSQTIFFL